MKKIPHHVAECLVPVSLQIRQGDIDEMEYHFNQCPMSNTACDNAVAKALKRIVKPSLDVQVHMHEDTLEANLGPWGCPLNKEIAEWLGKFFTGHNVAPIEFTVVVPDSVLRTEPEIKLLPPVARNSVADEFPAISA